MLELKRFNSDQVDLISAIAEEFTHFGFPSTPEFTTKALESGKLLVLLDGLDEVPNQFTNSVMNAIDNLVTKYEKNHFIASCRIAAYRSNFQHDFKVIELADFDDKQIQQFITNWFSTELDTQSQTAEKCWETLSDESNKAAKELAQTPLLLTFLCLVYNRKQSFPPTRSRLYNKALDILLEEWAAEKRLNQEPIHEGLHTDLEKVMLAEIAHEGFKNDQLFFDQNKIIKSITDFLADSVEKPKYLDGKKILDAIAAQQGILVQRAEDIYSFSHLTLQEYLTAQHINEDDSLVQQLISQHLTDRRWREVFLLVAGLKNDASKFLLAMEQATQSLIGTDKLHQLLVWAKDRTNNSPGDIQSVGRRAIVLAFAFANANARARAKAHAKAKAHALVYSLDLANANNGITFVKDNANANAKALAKALAKAKAKAFSKPLTLATVNSNENAFANLLALKYFIKYAEWLKEQQIYLDVNYPQLISTLKEIEQKIPDNQEAEEVHKAFVEKMIQIWLAAFHLQPEMVDLSKQEIQALDNYFYSNLLMVKCEKAAVKVSRKTWSEIEARMLMPFREPT